MDLQLKGKKVIVTGGSAGIGPAIARMLAEEGVEVTIPGRNIKKVNQAIATLSGKAHGIETDLGTAEGANKLIAQVPETDILVNNLGIYESKDFTDITDEDWPHYFEVNLLGGIRLARHYFPAIVLFNRNWKLCLRRGRVVHKDESGAGAIDEVAQQSVMRVFAPPIPNHHRGSTLPPAGYPWHRQRP
jgi:NAD(P)-dependent dehydrogenase (short-subunit alcohol dehydrogenase family)